MSEDGEILIQRDFPSEKSRPKGLEVPIYARVTINGERMEQSVKQKILCEDWNERAGESKNKSEEYKGLNSYLEQVRSSFVECLSLLSVTKTKITIETFKDAYLGRAEDDFTLCKLVNYHNQDRKDSVSWGTLKNYFSTPKYLQADDDTFDTV